MWHYSCLVLFCALWITLGLLGWCGLGRFSVAREAARWGELVLCGWGRHGCRLGNWTRFRRRLQWIGAAGGVFLSVTDSVTLTHLRLKLGGNGGAIYD